MNECFLFRQFAYEALKRPVPIRLTCSIVTAPKLDVMGKNSLLSEFELKSIIQVIIDTNALRGSLSTWSITTSDSWSPLLSASFKKNMKQ